MLDDDYFRIFVNVDYDVYFADRFRGFHIDYAFAGAVYQTICADFSLLAETLFANRKHSFRLYTYNAADGH